MMGIPVCMPEDDAPPLPGEQGDAFFFRDRALRLECQALAERQRRVHPGRLITATSVARELLWLAIHDPALRRRLIGDST